MTITTVTTITVGSNGVMVVMVVTVIPYCSTSPKHSMPAVAYLPRGWGVNLYGPSGAMRAPAQIFVSA